METSEDKKCCETKKCCPCRIMSGVFIVLIGVVMLLGALGVIGEKTAWIAASVFVILIGLQKACRGMCKCCDKS